MKTYFAIAGVFFLAGFIAFAADNSAPAEKTFDAPHGMKVSVKMVGPYGQTTDLQMICAFQTAAGTLATRTDKPYSTAK